jgi:hypothetical protein
MSLFRAFELFACTLEEHKASLDDITTDALQIAITDANIWHAQTNIFHQIS